MTCKLDMISENLRKQILDFRKLRDWEKFHTPRNLATAILNEASELLEPFRWSKTSDEHEIVSSKKQELTNEIADIAILITLFTHDLNIDLNVAIEEKLKSNSIKYPVEKSRGSSKKYIDL